MQPMPHCIQFKVRVLGVQQAPSAPVNDSMLVASVHSIHHLHKLGQQQLLWDARALRKVIRTWCIALCTEPKAKHLLVKPNKGHDGMSSGFGMDGLHLLHAHMLSHS
jgi:hypothetical protein